jgi:hypothetical protein
MKASYLFILNAVIALIFGLAFVLIPEQTTTLYGVDLGEGGIFIGRLFGAALLAFAVVTWLVRNAADSPERQAIILGLFVGDVVGFVASLLAQLAGVSNALGWSTVAIYLILAVGFGYLRFIGEPGPAEPASAG